MTESAYAGTPLAPLLSLFDGADEVHAKLADIHCPTLILSSREDHVVEPISGDVLERSVGGGVERVHLENSYHVATLDNDAALLEQKVVGFAFEVLGGPGTVAS
jgi:carboxylesterase